MSDVLRSAIVREALQWTGDYRIAAWQALLGLASTLGVQLTKDDLYAMQLGRAPVPPAVFGAVDLSMVEQAFVIADRTMHDQAMCHGLLCHEDRGTGPIRVDLVGPDQDEVATIEQCDPGMKEAYAWLSRRGWARLESDGPRQHLLLDQPKAQS